MKKVKLKVEGMTCRGCAAKVKKAIEKAGGKEVRVDLEAGVAEFLGEQPVENYVKAVEYIGYGAKPLV